MKLQKTRRCDPSLPAFEAVEPRRLMSATAVKAVDTDGPDDAMVTVGSTTYVVSSTRSGGGWSQIYSTKGSAKSTKQLLDLTKRDATISSIDDLTGTSDGRVFFTATGGAGAGRQLFQLDTTKGGYTQVTKDAGAFYGHVTALSGKLFLYDASHTQIVTLDANGKTKLLADTSVGKLFQAKGQIFYTDANGALFRSDGTATGARKVSGDVTPDARTMFASNDFIYFAATKNNLTSLYRSDGTSATPTVLAEDFSLLNNSSAELGDYVYFSGGYYNTSPKGGDGLQLYRVKSATGDVSIAAKIEGPNQAGRADGIRSVGTNIYFTAGDGDYIQSQGTTDRELYRYDTHTGMNKKVTLGNQLAPVDDLGTGGGTGVLGSYYFTASPTKDDFRFGTRALYRTDPTDDSVVKVASLPTTTRNNVVATWVDAMTAGAGGLFAIVGSGDVAGDSDTFFVPTPFSFVDPIINILNVQATDGSDELTMKIDRDDLVMTLNGIEERRALDTFTSAYITLKDGDDKFAADANVTINLEVNGDNGNDSIATGSGNDSILGGAGKNSMYGDAGDDRIRGSGGADYAEGGPGRDRIYGRGGNDVLHGNDGADTIYADDPTGPFGNDTLWGESGIDRLYGFGGDDVVYGGRQADSIFGGAGDDLLHGDADNDTVDGGTGTDDLWGDDGDDIFLAADGAKDSLHGGKGTDAATRDARETIVDLIEL